jgi:CBS domain-containing protein
MTSERDRGGPSEELTLETPSGKPAIIICPECGAENIQGTDYCVNCNSDLRTLDIPPDTWSPGIGPPGAHVGHLGHRQAIEVPINARVRDVVAKLRDEGHGCAVVTDNGRVVGIFTERDVLNRITPNRASAMDMPVAEAMTADPVLMSESESVLVAINKMGIGGFRHIPLVDERRHLRGIVSGRDVLEYVDQLVGDG